MKIDKQLQRDVLDELAWEPSVDAAEIGVSVENGVVILNGTVKSFTEKWTAERVAQRVEEFGLLQTNSSLSSTEIASTQRRGYRPSGSQRAGLEYFCTAKPN